MLVYLFFVGAVVSLVFDLVIFKKTRTALRLMKKKIVKGKLVDIKD